MSTLAPQVTVVESLVAGVVVVFSTTGFPVGVTPAYVLAANPGIEYPHEFVSRFAGAALVPLVAAKVSAPLARVVSAVLEFSYSL